MRKGNFALCLALVLTGCSVVGGTLAWLTADTDPVVNTFTYGDIDIELDETKVDKDGTPDTDKNGEPVKTTSGNEYKMIPGKEYLKDPAVTVLAGNEACWLFVKLEEKGGVIITNGEGSKITYDFDDYLTYTVIEDIDDTEEIEGWTSLLDASGNAIEGIYFRYVEKDTDNMNDVYPILKDNKISVPNKVTKNMLNALDSNGQVADIDTYPSLSITAYAVQYSGFEAEVSEGTTKPTKEQRNAAALRAWQVVENQ